MSESEIIKGCLNYNRESQKALYEQFHSKMLGICLRYSRDNQEAKTMLRSGFLKVFANLKSFNGSTPLENWIKEEMVKATIDHLRKIKQNLIVSTVHANDKTINVGEDITDDEIILQIDTQQILKAVQELTPAYRTVFNLFVVDKHSHKQIAEMLDISENTSESNLSKAKYNLRKNILRSFSNPSLKTDGIKKEQTKRPS